MEEESKGLLKEELKRFNSIMEYTFNLGEKEELLFDSLEEQEEEVTDVVDEIPEDLGMPPEEGGEEPTEEIEGEEMAEDPFGGDAPVEDEMAEEPAMEEMPSEEGEVEVDVTDIVDKAEEAKEEAAGASSKIDDLLGKFSELEEKLTGMDQIITKMDELEQEVKDRNPSPTEKLSMRSMDSFPYTVKLTDFWNDKEGYDATGEEGEEEEYTLTKKDIDDDYSEVDIRSSFNPKGKE
tara:strand:+ start:1019 stop:1726 length:708 start_codon:yes stop_codon:yes gene_type:complete